MSYRALSFGGISGAPMGKMGVRPLRQQDVERQLEFSSFALGSQPLFAPVSDRIEPLGNFSKTRAGGESSLIDGDTAPDAERFADLSLSNPIGPLDKKRSGSFRRHPDRKPRARGIKNEAILSSLWDF
jgi:hypothetical protein